MGLWQKGLVVFFAMLVLFQFSSVETKKKKKARNPLQVETLQKLCHGSSSSSRKNILELQAFFDLSKAFACLKVETCSRIPVCFVEDTPDLGHESLRYCSLWNLLLQGLQKNRRIEPVLEGPMSTRNHGKSRTDSSWDEVVSSLCHGANVYRFITIDTGEEGNASKNATSIRSSTTATETPHTETRTNRSTVTPTNGRSRRRRPGGPLNKFIRQLLRRKHINNNNNSTCEILSGCTRICVGQNERLTDVSDCGRFKIHCTSKRLFRRSQKSRKHHSKNRKPKTSRLDK